MPIYLHAIETAVPETAYPQTVAAEILKQAIATDDRKTERLIQRLYSHSGIDKRHSVLGGFEHDGPGSQFHNLAEGTFRSPSTEERNIIYTEAARRMAPELAAQVIESCPGVGRSEITHLITVSCTGFFQPGPDFAIVQALGLSDSVERYHLGFMGCYAAFPALRMAQAFCLAQPDAVVLVVCLEFCSLHLQWSRETDDLLAGSVFADGISGAIVRAQPPAHGGLQLDAFVSALAPAGEQDMAWTIGNEGFRMRLSSYVPELIQNGITEALAPVLARTMLQKDEIDHWAVHPGGRAILDRVERGLGLPAEALDASRGVLRNYGNMSSATIFFVLKAVQEQARVGERIVALAFGPGLTIESAVLTRV